MTEAVRVALIFVCVCALSTSLAAQPIGPRSAVTVNVMTVYTLDYAERYPFRVVGLNGVAALQEALDNSQLSHIRINLVGEVDMPYRETGSYSADLYNLRDEVGAFADFGALRQSLEADLVILVTGGSLAQGHSCAFSMGGPMPHPLSGFALINDRGCTNMSDSFAHEVGHLLGADHDGHAPSPGSTYNRGFHFSVSCRDTAGQSHILNYRTLMAYPTAHFPNASRLRLFSNPYVQYPPSGPSDACDAQPVGVEVTENSPAYNALRIAEWAPSVAQYAEQLAAGPVGLSGVRASRGDQSEHVRVQWHPSPTSNDYELFRSTDEHSACSGYGTPVRFLTQFDDVTAAPGVSYYYSVRNPGGPCSALVEGWRSLAAVSGIQATALSSSEATLSWDVLPSADQYAVFLNPACEGDPNQIVETSSTTIEGLLAGETYSFSVKAIGENGEVSDGTPCATSEPVNLPATPSYCPGDINRDGAVDIQDVSQFLGMWFANDPTADFDRDGHINVSDLLGVLAYFFEPNRCNT